MSCGIGHRFRSGVSVAVVYATAAALIRPLAGEPPYATGAAIKGGKIITKETKISYKIIQIVKKKKKSNSSLLTDNHFYTDILTHILVFFLCVCVFILSFCLF